MTRWWALRRSSSTTGLKSALRRRRLRERTSAEYAWEQSRRAARPSSAPAATTTTGHAVIDFFNSVNKIRIGGRRIFFEARVQIPTLSVAAQTFTVQIGIEDGNAAGLPANGIFFSYTHGTNSGQWVGVSRAGSTSTPINSSVAVVAGQWYELRAEINAARTVIEYYIDGVLIGTNNASNIPGATSGMRPMFQIDKSAGSTARTLLADYMYLKMFR